MPAKKGKVWCVGGFRGLARGCSFWFVGITSVVHGCVLLLVESVVLVVLLIDSCPL